MKKTLLILLVLAVAFCNSFAVHYANKKYVCYDSDNLADTTFIYSTSVRADSLFGHLFGTADSLGGNPWTAYLTNVRDTFGILNGTTLNLDSAFVDYSKIDTLFINKQLKVGIFNVDSAGGRDTGIVAIRDTVKTGSLYLTKLTVDASPDSALSVVDGLIKMAAWPTGGTATLWETDSNGDLQPALAGTTDALWELDENGDLQPQI